jgi:regulator of replication initiation timing
MEFEILKKQYDSLSDEQKRLKLELETLQKTLKAHDDTIRHYEDHKYLATRAIWVAIGSAFITAIGVAQVLLTSPS